MRLSKSAVSVNSFEGRYVSRIFCDQVQRVHELHKESPLVVFSMVSPFHRSCIKVPSDYDWDLYASDAEFQAVQESLETFTVGVRWPEHEYIHMPWTITQRKVVRLALLDRPGLGRLLQTYHSRRETIHSLLFRSGIACISPVNSQFPGLGLCQVLCDLTAIYVYL